jgi:hypothetical protein
MSQQTNISCSCCGEDFGPGDRGFSHCDTHAELVPDTILEDITTAIIATTETKSGAESSENKHACNPYGI